MSTTCHSKSHSLTFSSLPMIPKVLFKPVSSPLDSSQLQEDLNHLSSWSMNCKLSFNELKCFLLAFQSNHLSRSLPGLSLSAPSYHINGQVVNHCQHHKDLGIIMSSDLSWANHHASIVTQAYKKLGLLRRSFCSSNISTKKLKLYSSMKNDYNK